MSEPIRSQDPMKIPLLSSQEGGPLLSEQEEKIVRSTVKNFIKGHPERSVVQVDVSLLDRITVSYKEHGDATIKTAELMLYPKAAPSPKETPSPRATPSPPPSSISTSPRETSSPSSVRASSPSSVRTPSPTTATGSPLNSSANTSKTNTFLERQPGYRKCPLEKQQAIQSALSEFFSLHPTATISRVNATHPDMIKIDYQEGKTVKTGENLHLPRY